MIQRKQTLWLLLAAIAAFLTLKFPAYTGNIMSKENIKEFKEINAQYNLLLLLITNTVAVISIVTIFLYSNRNKQLIFSSINLLLALLTCYLYYWQSQKFLDGAYSITVVLILSVPIFIVMAIIGIIRDKKLIKSLDRLR
jgi:hypothetical protein